MLFSSTCLVCVWPSCTAITTKIKNKLDSFGAHEHGETTAVPKLGLEKISSNSD
jgi:hypothetical protein